MNTKRIAEWHWERNQRIAYCEISSPVDDTVTTIGYWIEDHPGPVAGEWDPKLWEPRTGVVFHTLQRARESV